MEQLEQDEQEFGPRMGRLLDTYAAELPAPTTDLVRGGLTRGRRMKQRRQYLGGLAVFTVTTALAGGVALTGFPSNGGGETQAGDATVTIPDFAPAASVTSPPKGKEAVTGKATVATLRDLLPGRPATSGHEWWDGGKDGKAVSAGGRLLTAAGQGEAETAVSLQGGFQLTAVGALGKDAARAAAGDSAGGGQDKSGKTAPDKSEAAKEAGQDKKVRPATRAELQAFYSCDGRTDTDVTLASCKAENLKDGSVLISYEERSGTFTRRTADLLRTDGTRIVLMTSNSADSKHGPADVSTPPLTLAELGRMVRSTDWQAWVDPSANEKAKGLS